jgi:ribbon-helix-helix CopG family protein
MGVRKMQGEPKSVVSVSLSFGVADAVGKLADSLRTSRSEIVERLLLERLNQMGKEREAQAIAEAALFEAGTPIGRLKAWVRERNLAGLTTEPEELAAKKAELEAEQQGAPPHV